VLPLVVEGLSNDEIGARLGVSVATANFHVRSLLRKFEVATRIELAVKAVARGHVQLMACGGAEEGRERWICAGPPNDDHEAEPPRRNRLPK
jgi:regulatory LuxR family protein